MNETKKNKKRAIKNHTEIDDLYNEFEGYCEKIRYHNHLHLNFFIKKMANICIYYSVELFASGFFLFLLFKLGE